MKIPRMILHLCTTETKTLAALLPLILLTSAHAATYLVTEDGANDGVFKISPDLLQIASSVSQTQFPPNYGLHAHGLLILLKSGYDLNEGVYVLPEPDGTPNFNLIESFRATNAFGISSPAGIYVDSDIDPSLWFSPVGYLQWPSGSSPLFVTDPTGSASPLAFGETVTPSLPDVGTTFTMLVCSLAALCLVGRGFSLFRPSHAWV